MAIRSKIRYQVRLSITALSSSFTGLMISRVCFFFRYSIFPVYHTLLKVTPCVNTFAEDAITGQNLACSSRSRSGFLQVARLTVLCCSTLCALANCVLRYLGEKRISRRCYVVRRTVIARCSDRSKTLSTNVSGGKKRCVK